MLCSGLFDGDLMEFYWEFHDHGEKKTTNKKTRGQYKTIQLESLVTSHFC